MDTFRVTGHFLCYGHPLVPMCQIREFFLYSDSNSVDVGANYFYLKASTPLSFVYQEREYRHKTFGHHTDFFLIGHCAIGKGSTECRLETVRDL